MKEDKYDSLVSRESSREHVINEAIFSKSRSGKMLSRIESLEEGVLKAISGMMGLIEGIGDLDLE